MWLVAQIGSLDAVWSQTWRLSGHNFSSTCKTTYFLKWFTCGVVNNWNEPVPFYTYFKTGPIHNLKLQDTETFLMQQKWHIDSKRKKINLNCEWLLVDQQKSAFLSKSINIYLRNLGRNWYVFKEATTRKMEMELNWSRDWGENLREWQ